MDKSLVQVGAAVGPPVRRRQEPAVPPIRRARRHGHRPSRSRRCSTTALPRTENAHSPWLTRGSHRRCAPQRHSTPRSCGATNPLGTAAADLTDGWEPFQQILAEETRRDTSAGHGEWERLEPHVKAARSQGATDARCPTRCSGYSDFARRGGGSAKRSTRPTRLADGRRHRPERGDPKVTSSVECPKEPSSHALARLCDPSRWAENSLFWFESSRLDECGKRMEPPGRNDGERHDWDGQLLEVVASTVAVFTAVLQINFQVDERPSPAA